MMMLGDRDQNDAKTVRNDAVRQSSITITSPAPARLPPTPVPAVCPAARPRFARALVLLVSSPSAPRLRFDPAFARIARAGGGAPSSPSESEPMSITSCGMVTAAREDVVRVACGRRELTALPLLLSPVMSTICVLGTTRALPLAGDGFAGGGGATTIGLGGRAYSFVHSRAVASCFLRFFMYSIAMVGTASQSD